MAAFLDIRPFWGFLTDPAAAPAVRDTSRTGSGLRAGELSKTTFRWQRDSRGHLVCQWERDATVAFLREKAPTGTRRGLYTSGAHDARPNSPGRAASRRGRTSKKDPMR
jgi:hypothetical protein